ncbi:MAG: glycosyltransferase family 4 protein [Flavobacteriales bacterium]|nr:glycosyltransferase family 4 protein [Flavobacteriales bacterium]
MKIAFLTFYFEPDLCAGSFRNTPLAKVLSSKLKENDEIVVITTQPNRYSTYKIEAPEFEERGNLKIHRIKIPTHKSGMVDQIKSFYSFYTNALKITKQYKFDLVYASSSRLFTAYLGMKVAKKHRVPYYVDVRDIFVDTMENILTNKMLKMFTIPILKIIESKTFKNANHINLISEGFHHYFDSKFKKSTYSFYSNGIDDVFLQEKSNREINSSSIKKIVYAGNIGQGQGLDKIIPNLAKELEGKYLFEIYGDGGAKKQLVEEINRLEVKNVILKKPVNRSQLIEVYNQADFLFLHLNDFKAFEKVLPSKLFEYGTFDVPIIAGVKGYARDFILKNLKNTIIFNPCNDKQLVELLDKYEYKKIERREFKREFKRNKINNDMIESMLNLLKDKE